MPCQRNSKLLNMVCLCIFYICYVLYNIYTRIITLNITNRRIVEHTVCQKYLTPFFTGYCGISYTSCNRVSKYIFVDGKTNCSIIQLAWFCYNCHKGSMKSIMNKSYDHILSKPRSLLRYFEGQRYDCFLKFLTSKFIFYIYSRSCHITCTHTIFKKSIYLHIALYS